MQIVKKQINRIYGKKVSFLFVFFLLNIFIFFVNASNVQAADCSVDWDLSARGCKTNCMKDGLYCSWGEDKAWADDNTNSCVVESTDPCPDNPTGGSYSFSCNINDCVLSCDSGYTKCGSTCKANVTPPDHCISFNQCTEICTACEAGYELVEGVCVGTSLKLANDSVLSNGYIKQSSNPDFYLTPNGNVGIGTDNPAVPLEVDGAGTIEERLTVNDAINSFNGITANNSGSFVSGYGIYVGGSDDNYFAGKVGIGITVPEATLHVNGQIRVGDYGDSENAVPKAYIDDNFLPQTTTLTMTGSANQVGVVPTGAQDLSTDRTWTFSLPQNIHTSATPQFARLGLGVVADSTYLLNLNGTKMHGTSTGIGIGTTIPGVLLDIDGGTEQVVDISGGRIMGLNLIPTSDSEAVPRKYLHDNFAPITGGAGSAFVQDGNIFGGLATLGTNDNYDLTFETNNARRMTIDTAGYVGIGTTIPSKELDVQGDIISGVYYDRIDSDYYLDPGANIFTNGLKTKGSIYSESTNDNYLAGNLQVDGTIYGNLSGFATTAGSADHATYANSALRAQYLGDSFQVMADAQGNVGIGTTIPGVYKLNVNGNVLASGVETTSLKVTGDPGLDKVLTDLDGDGTAVWKDLGEIEGVSAPSGGGTENYLSKWGSTGTDLVDSNIVYESNGNVGIGTDNPAVPLEVDGAGTIEERLTVNDAINSFNGITANNSGSFVSGYGIYVGGTADNYFAGKVGVGTTAPTGQMHISTATDIEIFRAEDETGTEAMVIDKDGNVIISL